MVYIATEDMHLMYCKNRVNTPPEQNEKPTNKGKVPLSSTRRTINGWIGTCSRRPKAKANATCMLNSKADCDHTKDMKKFDLW